MKLHLPTLLQVLLVTAAPAHLRAQESRPNVLFIAVDDLKPTLGCYGDTIAKTPNIDRIAAQGTTFLNAHTQQAVCAPSRASLLTGLRPDTTKVWDLQTRLRDNLPDVVTLPQFFKQQGYDAVGLGKIFDPRSVDGQVKDDPASWSRPYIKEQANPDSELGYLNPQTVARIREARAALKGGDDWEKARKAVGDTPPTEGTEDVPDNAYQDGAFADTAVNLIGELSKADKPFFLAVGFKKPHLPFVAPKKYWDLYNRADFPLAAHREPVQGAPEIAWQPGWELRSGYAVPKDGPLPEDLQRELLHGYYACTSYIDAQVGRLLDALKANGVADNTIIVFWGDHGWHLGDHGIWCKHTNYEQATRVPLIIADPKFGDKGGKSTSPVEFLDVFPTLVDLAGLPAAPGLQGASLRPILADPSAKVKDFAVSQFPRQNGRQEIMGYAYRDDRYRYVEWVRSYDSKLGKAGEMVARELYDYVKDPSEQRNLIDDPEYQETAAKFRETVAALSPVQGGKSAKTELPEKRKKKASAGE